MANISNPLSGGKTLDFKTFERLAKDSQVDNKATVHLATGTGGRVIVGLEAKTPIAGKKINLLGKPISDLSKATEAQRNGILATQAFKQALVQRYGETIANALDKHLLQSGKAKILTAEDLRKNLKVADAIVRILRATPATLKEAPQIAEKHNHALSNSSARRNEDGSPTEPSAPPRSRSSSTSSETSVNAYFKNRDKPPPYQSTEDLRASAPPRSRSASEVSEIDQDGNRWHHNTLFIKPDDALELAGESASLPEDPEAAKAAQRPRAKALSQAELEASFDDVFKLLDDKNSGSGKI
jgi:hypothetical protein